jgi:hypothetical protein
MSKKKLSQQDIIDFIRNNSLPPKVRPNCFTGKWQGVYYYKGQKWLGATNRIGQRSEGGFTLGNTPAGLGLVPLGKPRERRIFTELSKPKRIRPRPSAERRHNRRGNRMRSHY